MLFDETWAQHQKNGDDERKRNNQQEEVWLPRNPCTLRDANQEWQSADCQDERQLCVPRTTFYLFDPGSREAAAMMANNSSNLGDMLSREEEGSVCSCEFNHILLEDLPGDVHRCGVTASSLVAFAAPTFLMCLLALFTAKESIFQLVVKCRVATRVNSKAASAAPRKKGDGRRSGRNADLTATRFFSSLTRGIIVMCRGAAARRQGGHQQQKKLETFMFAAIAWSALLLGCEQAGMFLFAFGYCPISRYYSHVVPAMLCLAMFGFLVIVLFMAAALGKPLLMAERLQSLPRRAVAAHRRRIMSALTVAACGLVVTFFALAETGLSTYAYVMLEAFGIGVVWKLMRLERLLTKFAKMDKTTRKKRKGMRRQEEAVPGRRRRMPQLSLRSKKKMHGHNVVARRSHEVEEDHGIVSSLLALKKKKKSLPGKGVKEASDSSSQGGARWIMQHDSVTTTPVMDSVTTTPVMLGALLSRPAATTTEKIRMNDGSSATTNGATANGGDSSEQLTLKKKGGALGDHSQAEEKKTTEPLDPEGLPATVSSLEPITPPQGQPQQQSLILVSKTKIDACIKKQGDGGEHVVRNNTSRALPPPVRRRSARPEASQSMRHLNNSAAADPPPHNNFSGAAFQEKKPLVTAGGGAIGTRMARTAKTQEGNDSSSINRRVTTETMLCCLRVTIRRMAILLFLHVPVFIGYWALRRHAYRDDGGAESKMLLRWPTAVMALFLHLLPAVILVHAMWVGHVLSHLGRSQKTGEKELDISSRGTTARVAFWVGFPPLPAH